MATIEKGITISFKGDTASFEQSLDKVNKSLNKEKTIVKEINSELKLDPKNVELLQAKLGSLTKQEELLTTKIKEYNKALDDIDDKDIGGKQWETIQKNLTQANNQLSKVRGYIEETNDALNENGGINDLGKNIKNASDNASVFGDVLKANIVSDVVISGLKSLANAFVKVGESVYDAIRDSGKLADDINTLAKQYNLSTKEIQQFMKASDLVDVELSTITKSFSKLTKNMTSNSKDVQGAFKTLGIQVKENNGELRSSNDVFYEVIEALSQVKNETEQDNLALQIFGKSASDLGSLINGGSEQLAEFNKYLEENNLLLTQDELDALNDMNDSFDVLTETWESMKQKLASELAPTITPLVEGLTSYIIEHKQDIEDLVKNVVDYITSDEFKQVAQDIVDNVKDFVDDKIPKIKEDLPIILEGLTGIAKVLGGIAKVVLFIVDGLQWAFEQRAKDYEKMYNDLGIDRLFNSGGYGNVRSGGFGALQSGGYGSITLNASFVANGNLDEAQARRFASLMAQQINEELGGQL